MTSTFKTKTKTKKHSKSANDKITVDARHEEQTKYFRDLKSTLKPRVKELKVCEDKIKSYETKSMKNLSQEEMDELFELKDKCVSLKKIIQDIEENKEETNYYLKAGILVYQYYENKDKIAQGVKPTKQKKKKKLMIEDDTEMTILEMFQADALPIVSETETQTQSENNSSLSNNESIKNDSNDGMDIMNLNNGEYQSRNKIRNKYLSIIDNVYIKDDDEEDGDDIFICELCGIEKFVIQSQASLVCKECGSIENILIDSDKPSYKDPPKEASYFAYKRINHFNEWLAQFQAKESTDIPESVYNSILLEIKKERITNMATLTQKKLRTILKKLSLNKYYEHMAHIINRLNGIPAPVMTRETEEILRAMFKEIQKPFIVHCPNGRKNFLSYAYVLHKFCQLLGLDEFLTSFPLLKSREKLNQQDNIWKKICKDLHWQFIKSL